jgi:hypothetical protein
VSSSNQSLLIATEIRALEQLLADGLELLDGSVKTQAIWSGERSISERDSTSGR